MTTPTAPTKQSLAAVIRQILAIAALIMGPLTQALPSLHLPTLESAAITLFGGILLSIEHYVGDLSTGNMPPPPVVTAPDPAVIKGMVDQELARLASSLTATPVKP